jgi:uncharacterized protein YceH (UPF0502 family)
MPHFELSPVETRVLGCLLEKERLTPENYPISLHSLTAACNQTTNREPVTTYEERVIDEAVTHLRQEKLAIMIHAAGARVPKYRHNLPAHYELSAKEIALVCVLMLRGPQTPGELRSRTDRLYSFRSLEEVEATLGALAGGGDPLVRILPQQPGQKERRYVQLLSGEPTAEMLSPAPAASAAGADPGPSRSARVEALETEVAALRGELRELREQFETFRKQFEA